MGHHHVYETAADCVMPGSTEVQNMLDQSEKCVVVYDSEADSIERQALPKTHPVVALRVAARHIAPCKMRVQNVLTFCWRA